jgi:glucose-1-phosphate thymidylyltransferase
MIPIANEPMLFFGLRHLAEGGLSDVAVILGPLHEGIEEALGDGSSFGVRITYIHQGDPKGLAHAVLCARDFLGKEPFVMYLGDNMLQEGTRSFIQQFQENPCDAVVGVTPVSNPSSYGIAEMDGDRLVSIVEKPTVPRSNLALIGVYVFSPRIHPIIENLKPSRRGELEITDAIWKLHEEQRTVRVRRVLGWWKDTGRPEDLLEANDLVLNTMHTSCFTNQGTTSSGAKLHGLVRLGRGSFVASTAQIDGPAVIGNDVRIEGSVHLGPNVSIGNRCTLGRGSSVQRSIVMEDAVIEGSVTLSDCIIGRNARILAEADRTVHLSCIVGDSTRIRFAGT